MQSRSKSVLHSGQRGAATLMVSLILLFSLSMISMYSAKVSIIEQRIASNEYRAMQATQAAQAGLENGTNRLQIASIRNQIITDMNSDGLLDTHSNLHSSLTNTASFDVSYSNSAWRYDLKLIEVISQGWSDDKTALAVTRQTIQLLSLFNNFPDSSVTTYRELQLKHVELINTETDITAKAGANIVLENTNTSTSNQNNNGVTDNEPTIQAIASENAFFYHYFGANKAEIVSQSYQIHCINTNCKNQNNQSIQPSQIPSNMIWLTGTPRLISDIGSENEPVILIVDSDLIIQSDVTIWGVIYFTDSGHVLDVFNNTELNGALIAESDDFLINGELRIQYSNDIISRISANSAVVTIVAGSWIDF